MHPLDFISDSPNLFILHKESNKTNFGGVLFLLYIITMIIIIIYYSINYSNNNNKFTIQSLYHFNPKSEEEIEATNKDERFNQNISFFVNLSFNEEFLDKRFKLYNLHEKKEINRESDFSIKTNDFDLLLYYQCEEENCTDYYKNFDNNNNKFQLVLIYDGFSLDHQNEDEPIQRDYTFLERYNLKFNNSTLINNIWENIFYTEKKSYFLGEDNYNKSCGYINNYYKFEYPLTKNETHILLAEIAIFNDYLKYIEYKRVKFSKLDLLANILSLLSNIFFGTRILMKLYSKKFNNYKIIENILSKKKLTIK